MNCRVAGICFVSGIIAVWSSLTGTANAAPVAVANHSFEAEPPAAGFHFIGTNYTSVSGWQAATLRGDDFLFIGGLNNDIVAADGDRFAWMGTDVTLEPLYLSQAVGIVQADTVYTLTVAVGKPGGDALPLPNNWEIALYTGEPVFGGGSLIAERTNLSPGTAIPSNFTFVDNVLTWDSTGSGFVGSPLWIALGSPDGGYNGQVAFDNVRLDATPVPEPNALVLSFIGSAACGLIARNKRRSRR